MDNGACSYRRFLDGDDEGFVQIVKEYKDGLMLFINGYVGNVYVAEELMQDCFFKLLTKKPRFTPKHTFKSWLYTIGRNMALNYIRRKGDTVELNELVADEQDVLREYISKETRLEVLSALKKLNADYRQVLWLVYFEGMSPSDAAYAMKKSPRQISNLLYRAKAALKTILEKEGYIYEELY